MADLDGEKEADRARVLAMFEDVIVHHHRVNPPGGKCRCGHETDLGRKTATHVAEQLLAGLDALLAVVAAEGERTCRVCGCTDDNACEGELTSTCWWVEDDLCSACRRVIDAAGSLG